MESSNAKECAICTFEFDEEERCPRALPCFHTICSSCILDVIRTNDKKCPFCRQGFQGQRVSDFRVNNNVLDMLRYIRDLESKVSTSPSKGIEDLKRQITEINNTNISYSLKAESELRMRMETNNDLKRRLDEASSHLQNEVIPKAKRIICRNKRQALCLDLENEKMTEELEKHTKKQKQIKDIQEKINSIRTFSKAGLLMDDAQKLNSQFTICKQSFKLIIESYEKLHQGISKHLLAIEERISVIKEVLNSYEEEVQEGVDIMEPYLDLASLTIQEDTRRQLTTDSLMDRSANIHQLIEQQQIFAVQEFAGKTRHAKVSVSKNKYICIHHLSEEPVAPNSVVFQFEEAMELLNPMSRTCFLELKAVSTGTVLGKLMIRLTHDIKSAKNFELLCTGQLGPSYCNTKILNVADKGTNGERVWCGDYDLENGEGGKSLVPGAGSEMGGVLVQQRRAGSVTKVSSKGDFQASQFLIYTNNHADAECDLTFGFVEDGLEVLTGALHHYPDIWNEVVISDCGIVLTTL